MNRPKILIVEDDELVRHLLDAVIRMMPEFKGHELVHVDTVAKAIEWLHVHSDNLVLALIDQVLPDSHQNNSMIKVFIENEFIPLHKVVVISGSNPCSCVLGALCKGTRFVSKPFTPSELKVCLQAVATA